MPDISMCAASACPRSKASPSASSGSQTLWTAQAVGSASLKPSSGGTPMSNPPEEALRRYALDSHTAVLLALKSREGK